jgi:hypothetical protein
MEFLNSFHPGNPDVKLTVPNWKLNKKTPPAEGTMHFLHTV